MDNLLKLAGVDAEHVRRRMTAHAILASGWAQKNAWNHNAWKIKAGRGYTGDKFGAAALEQKPDGTWWKQKNAMWRSYKTWRVAISAWLEFMSSSQKYSKTWSQLNNPQEKADGYYWEEAGEAGYYTAKFDDPGSKWYADPGGWFRSICMKVRGEQISATAQEKFDAREWAKANIDKPLPSIAAASDTLGSISGGVLLVLALVIFVLVVRLTRKGQ